MINDEIQWRIIDEEYYFFFSFEIRTWWKKSLVNNESVITLAITLLDSNLKSRSVKVEKSISNWCY